MKKKSIQDTYPDNLSYCYGCGKLNNNGLHIKSFWDGKIAVCEFMPADYHTAVPGFVYGGLIASLIDCHATGTASAAAYEKAGRQLGSDPLLRFVTASLHVDFLNPTPSGQKLYLKGYAQEIIRRKVLVAVEVQVNQEICARGEVVTVQIPGRLLNNVSFT
jgi:acyl-coenzyme A thioesterase PaaI-like protein